MASSDTMERITSSMNKISKGKDIREEMMMLTTPHINWEDFLAPAPMCICLLGELMVISTAADFTLENSPPKDGFKLMRWPGSFRASLMQVSNAGYDAFKEAHTSMDQIRLLSLNVPRHLEHAVKIILQGSNAELEDLLPIPLSAIEDISVKGLTLATTVEEKFDFVMNLTGELLESCVGARGKYEYDLKGTEIALQITKENKKIAAEQKEISKKAYDGLEKSVKEAEKSYYQAMDSMPSGWQIIGMNLVEGICNSFTTVVSGLSRAATLGLGSSGSARKPNLEKNKTQRADGLFLDDGTIKAYRLAILLKTYTDTLVMVTVENGNLKKNLEQNGDAVIYAEKQYSNILKDAGIKGLNKVSDRVIELCEKGIVICKEIKQTARDFSLDVQTSSDVSERILSLHEAIVTLAVEGRNILGLVPTDTRAPNQRVIPSEPDVDGSAAQQQIQNARFKIQQTSAQLEYVREKYDMACDKLQEDSQKLGEIMAEIARLDMQKIDLEKIKGTLIKGIKALGELREQWGRIVMFFQMMSNLIKCCLTASLRDFSTFARKSEEHALKGYTISALKKDMIYQLAFQAAKLAHVVNMISDSYVEVSSGYVMDRIAGLGKLQGYNPEKNSAEIRKAVFDLHQDCVHAEKGIRDIMMKKRREFDHKIEARINNIRNELDKALPPPPTSDIVTERTKRAVDTAMNTIKNTEAQGTKGLNPEDFV